jgi:hypothetical protein
MAAPTYRFYPWVRRGLSAALPAATGPLPVRALAKVKITVTPELVGHREVRLLGPGDVIGLDQRLIVRTEPRRSAIDFEPNYVAAIDFDAPELPWLFTPAGAGPDERLLPWLVLIVVDRDRVKSPRVSRNRPLPFIKLEGALPATELPNLADSWAWAHTQRLMAGGGDDAQALLDQPDLNVSRLIAPRRLAPNRRWMACVVPAFDAGVAAGLGVPRPDPNAPLAPAWTANRTDLELPVYYHWDFDTGLAGDFEFLARKLKPVHMSAATRSKEAAKRARAYLGTTDGLPDTLAAMPPTADESATGSYIRLDAPLEMMDFPEAKVADVPMAFSEAVARATLPALESDSGGADVDGGAAGTGNGADSNDLLPPLYGDRHAKRYSVSAADRAARWLDELNLDPRTRIAARSGGDTVRRFQEDLMEVAWAQIGDVLNANAQLSRSRFLTLVAIRALERHVVGLSGPRVMALSAHMHARLRAADATVRTRISKTSLADTAFDPALRRLTSPVGRLSRSVARSVVAAQRPVARHALSRGIAEALQKNEAIVDPSIVPRKGLGRFTATVTPRADLQEAGVFLDFHHDAALLAAQQTGQPPIAILAQVREASLVSPNAVQFAVRKPSGNIAAKVVAIESDSAGTLTMIDPATRARTPLVTLDRAGAAAGNTALTNVLTGMPTAVLNQGTHHATVLSATSPADQPMVSANQPRVSFELRENRFVTPPNAGGIRRNLTGGLNRVFTPPSRIVMDAAVAPEERLFTAVIPPPTRDAATLLAVTTALKQLAVEQPPAEKSMRFIQAPIHSAQSGLAANVRTAIEPSTIFRKRAAAMVKAPDWLRLPGTDVFDPIMAAPVLKASFAELYARVAPTRFLPQDVELPEESITALLTNPRFVAAFMVGANHEMNRELLWRTYPTDGRGTSIRRFWNWFDDKRLDVDAIHAWPEAAPLVARSSGGSAQVVLVLRGRLLRRYPNTLVLLWKGERRGKLAAVPEDAAARHNILREPVFKMPIEPDLTLVGFDITENEFINGDQGGWYVVMQEPLTEPRFGLDEPTGGGLGLRPRNRNSLDWSSVPVETHLPPVAGALNTSGGAGPAVPRHSADVADRMLQRPVRVAIHATQIAPAFTGP